MAAVGMLAPRNSWFVFDHLVVLSTAAAVAGMLLLSRWRWRRSPADTKQSQRHRSVWVGTLVGTILCGISAASEAIPFGWDAGAVTQAATTLHDGETLSADLLDYFARFPNNIPLLLLELTTIRVGALFGLSPVNSLVLFQVLLVGLILACLGSVALLLGRPRRILPIQTVALVLIGLSPHVAVPSSDLPGAACVAVAVVVMTRASVADLLARRLLWAAAATLALTVGTVLKPHIAVVLMAGAVMVLLVVLQTRSWQATRSAAFALGIGAALIALTLAALNLAAQHGTGLTNDRLRAVREPFPVELWLASGTYDSEEDSPVRRYGAYNQQLVDSAAEVTDPQRQRDMLRERVRDQLASRGVTDNLIFLSRKIAWVWGDGTFWASGEGTDSHQQPTHNGPLLNELSTWLVASGEHYRLKASITQGLWLAVLACTAWGVLTSRSRCLVATWALALIGLTGYLMLFEARPRYLVVLLPVLLAITLTAAPPGRR